MKLFIFTTIALAFFACSSDNSSTASTSEKDKIEQSNEEGNNSSLTETKSRPSKTSSPQKSSSNTSSSSINSSSSIEVIADTVIDTTVADVDINLPSGYYEAETDNGKFVTMFRDSIFETYTENRTPSLFEGGAYSIKGNKLTLDPNNCLENSISINCSKTTYIATINTAKDILILINTENENSKIIYKAGQF